jgi:hypothetical protein
MMILTVSFKVFVSLRLADAAATVPIPAVTNAPAKRSVDEAFLGYTLVAGSCECLEHITVTLSKRLTQTLW